MDDYSKAVWVFLMKDKTETYGHVVNFFAMVRTQLGPSVQRVRSDNGTEFTNGSLQNCFLKHVVLHETSCVHTPQQNERVERKIVTFLMWPKPCVSKLLYH